MQTVTIRFTANGQVLKGEGCPIKIASNTVEYVKAVFTLGENWTGFDVVRAAWYTDFECISTVLDGNGECFVPWEVLSHPEGVTLNLYGCDLEEESDGGAVLVDRLTTYPVKAILVDVDARVCGSETKPVTPSQFEQYIAIVQELVGTVRDITSCVLNPDYTLTINYSDGTSDTVGPIRGEKGATGATGATGNGIQSIAKIGTAGLVDTYRITYTNGSHYDYTVTNGAQGPQGNGIVSIYKSGESGAVKTYTILFTNGDTYEYQVTDGEVTNAVLEQVLPTDTASGAIASFPDGTNLFPLKKCEVTLEPIQDLSHGDPSPSNICPISGRSSVGVTGCGKNLLNPSAVFDDDTRYTVGTNGKVTALASDGRTWTNNSMPSIPIKKGTYTFSRSQGLGYCDIRFKSQGYATANTLPPNTLSKTFTLTEDDEYKLKINYSAGNSNYPLDDYVQLELGSTATAYEEYVAATHTIPLGQTVYGGDVEVVEGKLFDGGNEWVEVDLGDLIWSRSSGASTPSGYVFSTQSLSDIIAKTDADGIVGMSDRYGTDISWQYTSQINDSCFMTNNAGTQLYIRDDRYDGMTGAQFQPYVEGVKFYYKLKKSAVTPVSITPTQIQTLKGQNNIFSDSGDTDVTYKADTQLWVEKKLGA